MPYFLLRLSAPHLLPTPVANSHTWTFLRGAEYACRQPVIFKLNYHESFMKKVSPLFASVASLRHHSVGILQMGAELEGMSSFCNCLQSRVCMTSSKKEIVDEKGEKDSFLDSHGSLTDEFCKEEQRRRKIGLANKGKVPWNKGRKHSEETRMRIKERTIEALRDPKVRKKMSEYPHMHSDQTKAKIRSSLRRVWDNRLKWRQLKEKFFLSWLESIAEAARKGASDQQELDWNSYEKLKQELELQQLQQAEEKVKAKEMAKKAAWEKAEKMAVRAQKRKEREEKAKAERDIRRRLRRSKKDEEDLVVAKELKLKRRLTKIHRRKCIKGRVAVRADTVSSVIPAWDTLDVELIRKEKMQRNISLADQIQAAKNRRLESMVGALKKF